jgi:hypothetical protein
LDCIPAGHHPHYQAAFASSSTPAQLPTTLSSIHHLALGYLHPAYLNHRSWSSRAILHPNQRENGFVVSFVALMDHAAKPAVGVDDKVFSLLVSTVYSTGWASGDDFATCLRFYVYQTFDVDAHSPVIHTFL